MFLREGQWGQMWDIQEGLISDHHPGGTPVPTRSL